MTVALAPCTPRRTSPRSLNRVTEVRVLHGCADGSTTEAVTQSFYDGSTSWGAMPTRGNLTMTHVYSGGGVYADTRYGYDAYGRVTSTVDPRQGTTTTVFNPATGNPDTVTVTDPARHVTVSSPDPAISQPLRTTDPNGHVTTYHYDGLGRLTQVWEPTEPTSGTASWQFDYTNANPDTDTPAKVRTRQLQSAGVQLESWQIVDGFGRTRQTQTPSPAGGRITTTTSYNERGLTAAVTAPQHDTGTLGVWTAPTVAATSETRTTYDDLQRVIVDDHFAAGALRWQTTTTWDGPNSTVRPPDPTGGATRYDVNTRGQTIRTIEYADHAATSVYATTTTSYTTLGQLDRVTDAAGHVTDNDYDWAGQRVRLIDPNQGTSTFNYDASGNQTESIDARGDHLWSVYDALNRRTALHQTSTTGPLLASWTYDTGTNPDGSTRLGLLVATASNQAANTYTTSIGAYDARNRVTAKTWTIPAAEGPLAGSYTFGYGYDAADHQTTKTYPAAAGQAAQTVTTAYSNLGQPTTLTAPGRELCHRHRIRPGRPAHQPQPRPHQQPGPQPHLGPRHRTAHQHHPHPRRHRVDRRPLHLRQHRQRPLRQRRHHQPNPVLRLRPPQPAHHRLHVIQHRMRRVHPRVRARPLQRHLHLLHHREHRRPSTATPTPTPTRPIRTPSPTPTPTPTPTTRSAT